MSADPILALFKDCGISARPKPLDVARADVLWTIDKALGDAAWDLARYIAIVDPADAQAIALRGAILAFQNRQLPPKQRAEFERIDGLQHHYRTEESERLAHELTCAYLGIPADADDAWDDGSDHNVTTLRPEGHR